MTSQRPRADEYGSFYSTYVDEVPDGDVLETLAAGVSLTRESLSRFLGDREIHRYAPRKWSVREVIGHVIDTERVFAFRALSFARQDPGPLRGMDQEDWARSSNAHERPLAGLAAELETVRATSLALFRSLSTAAWDRRGIASENPFTVRALAWIVAGHEIHHRRILDERY